MSIQHSNLLAAFQFIALSQTIFVYHSHTLHLDAKHFPCPITIPSSSVVFAIHPYTPSLLSSHMAQFSLLCCTSVQQYTFQQVTSFALTAVSALYFLSPQIYFPQNLTYFLGPLVRTSTNEFCNAVPLVHPKIKSHEEKEKEKMNTKYARSHRRRHTTVSQ